MSEKPSQEDLDALWDALSELAEAQGESSMDDFDFAGIHLKRTCYACPEQYDAQFEGQDVGYVRLRHGRFRVEVPSGGEVVYSADIGGDSGIFDEKERTLYLSVACVRIRLKVEEQKRNG